MGVLDYRQHPPMRVARWVRVLLTQPESALHRAINPNWQWNTPTVLLADAVNSLRLLFWAKTEDGMKNRNRPPQVKIPDMFTQNEEQPGTVESLDVNEAEWL